jgi:hypothetical protein
MWSISSRSVSRGAFAIVVSLIATANHEEVRYAENRVFRDDFGAEALIESDILGSVGLEVAR